MTRHIMFEAFHGGKWWKKLICSVFCHTWKKIIDTKIGQMENHEITMMVWRCVDCGVYQLWIGKEFIVPNKRRER